MTRLSICMLLSLCTTLTASELPYGHPDFIPSPERPIGFAADGSGWYPGASSVREFWMGTPKKVKLPFHDRRKGKIEVDVWSIKDGPGKNIAWSTRMPSWSNSQPIVVGNGKGGGKVFSYSEPYALSCCDLVSGELLWTFTANPWLAAGVPASEAQLAMDLHAVYIALPHFGAMVNESTVYRDLKAHEWQKFIPLWQADQDIVLQRLKTIDPDKDYSTAAAATMKEILSIAEKRKSEKKPRGLRFDRRALTSLHDAISKRIEQLTAKTIGNPRKRKVRLRIPWGHEVGTMCAPVSDGSFVYAEWAFGQTVCLDLDGKLQWQCWFPNKNNTPCQSMQLADGVLVSMHGRSLLRGLDAATGAVVWERNTQAAAVKPTRGGYYVGNHKVVSLGAGTKRTKFLVTTLCNIIRIKDGEEVGHLPWPFERGPSGGSSIISTGEYILKGMNADGGSIPTQRYKLQLQDDGTVQAKHLGAVSSTPGYSHIAHTDRLVIFDGGRSVPAVYDAVSADVLADARSRIGKLSDVIVGNQFFYAESGSGGHLSNWKGRRPDGQALVQFHSCDLSSPDQPYKISSRCLLGGSHFPAMPEMEAYTPALYADSWFTSSAWGKPAHRLNADCAITAHGSRLLIRSISHLHCIAPLVEGGPTDDKALLAAIGSETDPTTLASYLQHSSPAYRYAAVKRCPALAGMAAAQQAQLTSLAKGDSYEDIRAAAIIALDSQGDNSGSTLFKGHLHNAASKDYHRIGRIERSDVGLTLVSLGDAANSLLTTMLGAESMDDQRLAAGAIARRRGGTEAQQQALIGILAKSMDGMQNRPPRELITLCSRVVEALASWPSKDPAVEACFQTILNHPGFKDQQATLTRWMLRSREGDAKRQLLKRIVEKCPHDFLRKEYMLSLVKKVGHGDTRDAELLHWFTDQLIKTGEPIYGEALMRVQPWADAQAALLQAMHADKALGVVARFLLPRDIETKQILQRLQTTLPKLKGRNLHDTVQHMGQGIGRMKQAESREQAVQVLIGVLTLTDTRAKEFALGSLESLKGKAISALPAIEALDSGNNKHLEGRKQRAIKAIKAASP